MAGKLRKDAGVVGLLFAGVGGMIGSGWLLGPLHAAQQAGPLSIGSWAIAAFVVGLLALNYAELAPMFPRSGGVVHMSHVTHGMLLGRIWTWILFLAYVTIPPVEAMAMVNYANNYIPGLIKSDGLLTGTGLIVSLMLLAMMVGFNFLAVKLVLAINTVATWIKLATPIGTILVFMAISHQTSNLAVAGHGGDAGMFTAISTAGVFFALFGFRQAIDLAGETDNPGRNLPIAVLGTIAIGTVVFIVLQYAFVTAIPHGDVLKSGWGNLSYAGASGPFAGLAVLLGASWWAAVLYVDAIVSPGVCGFIWSTTTSRVIMAAGETGDAHESTTKVSENGSPWVALIVTYVIGVLFFLPLPSWQKMVSYASAATVLSYGIGPIVLLRMRAISPNNPHRSFRLPLAGVLAPAGFIAANFVVFWSGFSTVDFMFLLLLGVCVIYGIYAFGIKREATFAAELPHFWWLAPYFGGLWLLSLIGPTSMGGIGLLSIYADMAVIAVFSLGIMKLALATAVPDHNSATYYYGEVLQLEGGAPTAAE